MVVDVVKIAANIALNKLLHTIKSLFGDMRRLAALAGLAEPFVFVAALVNLTAVGFVALIASSDLLAEMTTAVCAEGLLQEGVALVFFVARKFLA
jgi:hypothetical protein